MNRLLNDGIKDNVILTAIGDILLQYCTSIHIDMCRPRLILSHSF